MDEHDSQVDHYDAQYGNFATELYRSIRSDAFGEDIGQNGWLTATEQDEFLSWLELSDQSRLLDIACGSGGPTLRVTRLTGCYVHGVDIHEQGIAAAKAAALQAGVGDRADFSVVDASAPLPFDSNSFDAVTCIDAVNHLPERADVFEQWAGALRPGGSVLFTDPIVVTGPLTNEEMRIRSSIGFFLFVPAGTNERLLEEAGFDVERVADHTDNMAQMAERWRAARQKRAEDLRKVEGAETFEGQQEFFTVAARLASERRLSRIAFHARLK